MKVNRLWETPVWEIDNPDHVSMNAQLLEAMSLPREYKQGTSFNFLDVEHPGVERIKKYVADTITQALSEYSPGLTFQRIERSWVVTQEKGEWHSPHEHASNLLIGVYYIQAAPGASSLYLLNPAPTSVFSNGLEKIRGIQWDCRSYFEVQPTAGKLVLFPGIMKHFVMPNMSEEPRVSLAMNIKLKRDTSV